MMIVDKITLEIDKNKNIYHCGKCFNGIAVDIVDGIIVNKDLYLNGKRVGDCKLPFTVYDFSKQEIDAKFLNGDDEPYTFKGQLYNGISYSLFDGEYSIINQYENGEIVSEAKYSNERLINLEHVEPDESVTQDYSWYENGDIKDFSIFAKDKFQVALHFEPNKKISLLTIRGDYFVELDSIKSILLNDYFHNEMYLTNIVAGCKLNVSGLTVTDEVFSYLIMNNGLEGVEQLQIYNTGLTETSVDKLSNISTLTELYIESDLLTNDYVKTLKQKKPDCYVRFNSKEIVI
ncbi:hypothetical protein [Photobacterium nomapromontoriensis]|uniref:hypothetical protein n=1 Tax=Photobacterium nomapromontoriensis TaxID=2910237 RepID=UPI003D0F4D16